MGPIFLAMFLLAHVHLGQTYMIPNNTVPLNPPAFAFVEVLGVGASPGALSSPAVGFQPDGKQLYVIGGQNNVGDNTQAVYSYDFNASTWTKSSSLTRTFYGPCYAQYTGPGENKNRDIWLYSRTDNANAELARFNFTVFNVVSWESKQVAYNGGCTVTSEARFFVFGGSHGAPTNCSNDLYWNNGSKVWEYVDVSKSAKIPDKRTQARLISYNDTHLYMFGGVCGEVEYDDLWLVDVASGIWTEIVVTNSEIPPARYAHSLTYDFVDPSPRLIVFGGKSVNETLDDTWRFDINTATWTEMGHNKTQEWPSTRSHFGHSFSGGRLIVFGGEDYQGDLNGELWHLVLNDDCLSRKTCEDCVTQVSGCGWCSRNNDGFQCIAGSAYGPYLGSSCVNATETTWTVEFLTCPLDEFPGWIIALVIIGCIVLVGVVIYFVMRMKQKSAYEVIG